MVGNVLEFFYYFHILRECIIFHFKKFSSKRLSFSIVNSCRKDFLYFLKCRFVAFWCVNYTRMQVSSEYATSNIKEFYSSIKEWLLKNTITFACLDQIGRKVIWCNHGKIWWRRGLWNRSYISSLSTFKKL